MAKKEADTLAKIKELILKEKEQAYKETKGAVEPSLSGNISWPVECTVGPGLEGAIACESKIGYVNGSKGWLLYRGYNIFDLCAYSTFEEVSFLLLHGHLPNSVELETYTKRLQVYRHIPRVKRLLMSFPIEEMSAMAALRLGTNLMRQIQTYRDREEIAPKSDSIATDEDSIAMETWPTGDKRATYEFRKKQYRRPKKVSTDLTGSEGLSSCYHLIAGVPSIVAAIARVQEEHLPIEPDPHLGHAANFLYMLTGNRPTPVEERIMDICLILHLDHGMNASTFASMVVASTLSDVYFSIGSGIAALNGPLHGGANERVLSMVKEIGTPENVDAWYADRRKNNKKIMGMGHRVYKTHDPRARILTPLARLLTQANGELKQEYRILKTLEKKVVSTLGKQKNIFPNVDFYSGIVYKTLGISQEMFTPIFAVARIVGWCARVLEYLENNRIFRPRSIYTGPYNLEYEPLKKRK